ncbi:MAG: hypothetical protein ACOC4D_00005 [Bacteroidota bacterium]
MKYKLYIKFQSQVSFIDPIMFDSLLLSFWIKDTTGFIPSRLNIPVEEIVELPEGLLKEKDGYYLASQLCWQHTDELQYTSYWTKHFHHKNYDKAYFKGKRKILTNKGENKSYNIPMLNRAIRDAYFVFETENLPEVQRLLSKHLLSLGKKRNRGNGRVADWSIEETSLPIVRPVPAENGFYIRLKPPYWEMSGSVPCEVQEI